MHIRPMTKRNPAKASDITYIFDTIAQLLSLVATIQALFKAE